MIYRKCTCYTFCVPLCVFACLSMPAFLVNTMVQGIYLQRNFWKSRVVVVSWLKLLQCLSILTLLPYLFLMFWCKEFLVLNTSLQLAMGQGRYMARSAWVVIVNRNMLSRTPSNHEQLTFSRPCASHMWLSRCERGMKFCWFSPLHISHRNWTWIIMVLVSVVFFERLNTYGSLWIWIFRHSTLEGSLPAVYKVLQKYLLLYRLGVAIRFWFQALLLEGYQVEILDFGYTRETSETHKCVHSVQCQVVSQVLEGCFPRWAVWVFNSIFFGQWALK